jgi:hypothetical protein
MVTPGQGQGNPAELDPRSLVVCGRRSSSGEVRLKGQRQNELNLRRRVPKVWTALRYCNMYQTIR